MLLVVLPGVLGTVLGGLYATRTDRNGWGWVRKFLSPEAEERLLNTVLGRTPAPRAWDDLFSERPSAYLRVRTESDAWIAGRFDSSSYAGGFPHDPDLYLKEAWQVDQETGALGSAPVGYSVYVPGSTIRWIEVVAEQGNEQEGGDDG